jgi:Holliday junction resolvase RusA-like endonuclease
VTYTFEVPGRPQAKQSMRVARIGGIIRTYQPTEVVNYHATIATYARQVIQAPIEGAVAMHLAIWLRMPASWSKKRKAVLNRATTRPDVDNVAKAFLDGMSGVAWLNDRQVVDLHITKGYGTRDVVVVSVTEL